MIDRLREDVRTARETDPAAKSTAEVLLYAGLHAVWAYRLAHWLWRREHRFAARLLSQIARLLTGVEIHPGADLGRRVFVDHGMGVVVGETAEIGDDVTMYHGVTLGGDDPRPVKRHPTVEDGATLGANSTLVGDITVGEDASVGAGAVVVEDVPPGATVVGNPAERVDGAATDSDTSAGPDSTGAESESGTEAPPPEGTRAADEARPDGEDSAESAESANPSEPPTCCGRAGAS